jgi:hypothetical protein
MHNIYLKFNLTDQKLRLFYRSSTKFHFKFKKNLTSLLDGIKISGGSLKYEEMKMKNLSILLYL